jgi:predicted ATPase/class 3 adenylate cyclase
MASTASTGSPRSTPFGDLLRRYRQAAGLTQAELAELSGLSVRGINDLERGVRQTPRKDTVVLLAQGLGLADEERAAFVAAARRSGTAASAASAVVAPCTDLSETTVPASALPSGTVTFLFTDIESSTRLLQELGAARYAQVRAQHERLLRAAVAAHGGREVDSQGESFFVAFSTAPDALAAAAEAQRALATHAWPAGAMVRVRMGLHTGTAQVAGARYIGLDVHRAARIAVAGHGGQVLLSQTTRDLVEDALPDGASLRELGAHRLKDLQRPEHLHQLVLGSLPGLPADFPPLATLDAHPNNLPIQLTSFVGRARELEELQALLLANRLLTLTGPGGTGKTRLALSLAADVLERFADGVWLVELAPLADPTLVPQTVAAALGVREQPGRPILDVLLDSLRPKALLLVLDNCEHLIATCAQVAETLLRAAPSLQLLASSREALGVAGETVFRVPSLPLPDPVQPGQPDDHDRELAALAQNDCVRLFVERAAASSPPFRLTARNAPAIAQIGRRLDGIPLALELAAARTWVLPPDQIVARLDDRFRLLTAGSRTALPRHQTLLALIDWSHELLSEAERMLLRRLSVFAGGWSLEAAQAVGGEGLGEAGNVLETLETLAHLAEKSLIEVEESLEAAEGRYRLLETIRQYARDKLVASGEAERVRDRHLEYFVQFAEQAEPHLRGAEQLTWLGRVEREHDNLRTALAWALEGGKRENALRLAGALYYFWELRGYWSEGQKWLDDALALSARQQSGGVVEGEVGESSIPPRGEAALRAKALYAAGRIQFAAQFDVAGSRTLVEESLRLWRELDDRWWMAVVLEHIGFMLSLDGDVQTSRARLEEGVALAREVKDRWPLALCLGRLAYAVATVGDMAAARRMGEEWMAVARSVGDKGVLSLGLTGLAPLYWLEGNLTVAASIAEEGLSEARAIGSVSQVFVSLLILIFASSLQGDLAKARGHCFEMLAYSRETGASHTLLMGLIGFGVVACFGGEAERGVHLIATGETLLRQHGLDLSNMPGGGGPGLMIIGQALEKAREQLGPADCESAWAEGEQMTLEQALAFATENESEGS